MKRMILSVIMSAAIAVLPPCHASAAGIGVSETNLPVPENIDTSFKSYMDYRTITVRSSDQYKLQQQAYTDSCGLRRIGDDVCIAVGTAYSETCGKRLEISLDSGSTFTAIVGDIKADCDTDRTNRYCPLGNGRGDMIEFIVETEKLDSTVRRMGNIGTYEEYSGNVTAIKEISDN